MDDGGVKLEELLVVALRVTCLRLDHVRLLIFYFLLSPSSLR